MTENYNEIVGIPTGADPYQVGDAISRACPACRAEAQMRCANPLLPVPNTRPLPHASRMASRDSDQ